MPDTSLAIPNQEDTQARLAQEQAAARNAQQEEDAQGSEPELAATAPGIRAEPKLALADDILLMLFAVTVDIAGVGIVVITFAWEGATGAIAALANLIPGVGTLVGLAIGGLNIVFYAYAFIFNLLLTLVALALFILFLKFKGLTWKELSGLAIGGGIVETVLGFLPTWTLLSARIIIKDKRRI